MSEPPATAQLPRRRPTVGVGVLLAVVIGAFAWGLAMYAFGAATHAPGPPADPGEAALSQLSRIDQALAADDAASARVLLVQLVVPPGPAWTAARALRERSADGVARRAAENAAEQARAHRLAERLATLQPGGAGLLELGAAPAPGGALLALAYGAANGVELRVSQDGGGHWSAPAEPLRGQSWRLVHQAHGPLLLVLALAEGGSPLAWTTRDGRSFSTVEPPDRALGGLDGRWAVGGDGALVAAARGAGNELCLRSVDGGRSWQAGMPQASLLLIAPTPGGTLALARGPGAGVFLSDDGGASWHEGGPELSRLIPPGAPPRLLAIGGGCLVVAHDGARLLDAGGRLLAPPVLLPGKGEPEALIAHPLHPQRWYALHDRALWRSDDGGAHWRRGHGRLGELPGRCLEFTPGGAPRLLIGGDALSRLDDDEEPLLFDEVPAP